jgi:chemotaxis response regulator CheB
MSGMEPAAAKSSEPGVSPPSGPMVVGIGTSAGGLAALRALFSAVPAENGLAWVIVVHLSPEHESHLADLLQPYVRMPVQQVTETVSIERNHVYVIPPGANLNTIDTHLRLFEPRSEPPRPRAGTSRATSIPPCCVGSSAGCR